MRSQPSNIALALATSSTRPTGSAISLCVRVALWPDIVGEGLGNRSLVDGSSAELGLDGMRAELGLDGMRAIGVRLLLGSRAIVVDAPFGVMVVAKHLLAPLVSLAGEADAGCCDMWLFRWVGNRWRLEPFVKTEASAARGHLMDEVLLKTRELLFKFGEECKVDIWDDKLPREEKIESMLSRLQKYDLESGVDNANLEHQVEGIHRATRKYY